MAKQTYRLHWQGIEIEARYEPACWSGAIAHLEIESVNPARARLPMTDTGYQSHYHPIGTIEAEYDGDVIKAVTDWLNQEAQSKAWKTYVESSKQLTMF